MTTNVSFGKIGYVILFVKDAASAASFYHETLGIPVRFSSREWSELETSGVTLALHACEQAVPVHQPAIPEVVFSVEDVRAAHATLKERQVKVHELKAVHAQGDVVGVSAEFHDPDGNRLSIYGTMPATEWKGSAPAG